MQIYQRLTPIHAPQGSAVALGYFDGVHLGHRAVLSAARAWAQGHGAATAASSTLKGGRILSLPQKHVRVASLGIEEYQEAPFDEFRALTPEDFVQKVLVGCFNAKQLFCGDNFTFGARAAGNVERLRELCAPLGIGDPHPRRAGGGPSRRRQRHARHTLRHRLARCPRQGHRQRKARHADAEPELPRRGPAALRGRLPDPHLSGRAATGIGKRPTVDSSENAAVTCETFVPDFSGNAYGQQPVLEFHKYFCPVRKFNSMDELAALIHHAADESKAYFAALNGAK